MSEKKMNDSTKPLKHWYSVLINETYWIESLKC